jgi:hypothetical protein
VVLKQPQRWRVRHVMPFDDVAKQHDVKIALQKRKAVAWCGPCASGNRLKSSAGLLPALDVRQQYPDDSNRNPRQAYAGVNRVHALQLRRTARPILVLSLQISARGVSKLVPGARNSHFVEFGLVVLLEAVIRFLLCEGRKRAIGPAPARNLLTLLRTRRS